MQLLTRHRRRTGWNQFWAWACFPDNTGLKSAEWRPTEPVARERRRREAHGPSPRNFFFKLIAGKAFSKHFRRFLVTLKERVIPRKRPGELDSDPKMNQTERWLPVHEQPRSAVAGSSESTCDQLGCSPNKIIFHSRQMQTARRLTNETTPYPTPISKNSSANGCSRNFELFSFFRVFKKNFWGHFSLMQKWIALRWKCLCGPDCGLRCAVCESSQSMIFISEK